jgi:outer membrane protein assembly factor BamE (lipoprotein component of BamABCDE complex)
MMIRLPNLGGSRTDPDRCGTPVAAKLTLFLAVVVAANSAASSGCGTAERREVHDAFAGATLYTCCNLRPSGRHISDANWYETSTVIPTPNSCLPVGTRAQVVDVGRSSVTIRTEAYGEFTIAQEYGDEPLNAFVAKFLLRDDPSGRLDHYEPRIQDAVWEGRIVKGMTKEQVIMAIGYPPTHRTPSTTSNEWTYWTNRFRTYRLQFGRDGRLSTAWGALPGKFQDALR